MAEEFVDLYEVLELPVDADRNVLRKRINELYLDAQRNLDHRNFATRVKFQELFEVTLPQARYILLDEGRRDEYNRLVVASRTAKSGVAAPPATTPKPANGGFALEQSEPDIPDVRDDHIDAIPSAVVDPEKLAQEREELWSKWKVGLEEALGSDKKDDAPKARSAATANPTSFTVAPQPTTPTPAPSTPAAAPAAAPTSATAPPPATTAATSPTTAPKSTARPKVNISFDFDEKPQEAAPADTAAAAIAGLIGETERQLTEEEIEARRTAHRRQIMKELLVNVGILWNAIGAAIVVVPGIAALVAIVGHYYPRGATPLLKFSPNVIWGVGFLVIAIAAYFVAGALSKAMRRKKAQELSFLSYEDLLKQSSKS